MAPTQEFSEGKIRVSAIHNLREQGLIQTAGGGQRALSRRPLSVRGARERMTQNYRKETAWLKRFYKTRKYY